MKKVVAPVELESNPSATNTQSSKQSQKEPDVEPSLPRNAKTQLLEQRRRRLLPPELMEILVPSFKVGAATAAVGVFSGAGWGIVHSQPVGLSSIFTGVQWFTLGSSYMAARQVVFRAWEGNGDLTALDEVKASGMAGGFAGMMGGLLRGPRNIVPGIISWSLFGAGGQAAVSALSGRGLGSKFLASNFSPVTPLTDRQYEKMLEEKLLKLDAELAIIDDNLKAIREGKK